MIKVGLIGLGGISQMVIQKISDASEQKAKVIGVLCRPGKKVHKKFDSDSEFKIIDTLEDLISLKPSIVAECAGHDAVRQYGEKVLMAGTDLMIISTGALADTKLFENLIDSAKKSQKQIYIPSGAIGGVDALSASKLSGLKKVCYRSRKPPKAWKGTPAESIVNLEKINEAFLFFQGNARQASLNYPKNANVASTIALAGLGFDDTKVELWADPNTSKNIHEINVEAHSGNFQCVLEGIPSSENPKTSLLTACSVARALGNLGSSMSL